MKSPTSCGFPYKFMEIEAVNISMNSSMLVTELNALKSATPSRLKTWVQYLILHLQASLSITSHLSKKT
jgi:hypothetical protein